MKERCWGLTLVFLPPTMSMSIDSQLESPKNVQTAWGDHMFRSGDHSRRIILWGQLKAVGALVFQKLEFQIHYPVHPLLPNFVRWRYYSYSLNNDAISYGYGWRLTSRSLLLLWLWWPHWWHSFWVMSHDLHFLLLWATSLFPHGGCVLFTLSAAPFGLCFLLMIPWWNLDIRQMTCLHPVFLLHFGWLFCFLTLPFIFLLPSAGSNYLTSPIFQNSPSFSSVFGPQLSMA